MTFVMKFSFYERSDIGASVLVGQIVSFYIYKKSVYLVFRSQGISVDFNLYFYPSWNKNYPINRKMREKSITHRLNYEDDTWTKTNINITSNINFVVEKCSATLDTGIIKTSLLMTYYLLSILKHKKKRENHNYCV